MSTFSPKAIRMIQALEQYKNNCKRWDSSQILNRLNFKSAADGKITGSFQITEDICNYAKTLHGGFTTSIIDTTSVCGIINNNKGFLPYTTDINVAYISKGYIGDIVDIDVKPIYVSKTRATMECVLTKQKNGTIIAKAIVGFLFPDPPILNMDELPFDPQSDK